MAKRKSSKARKRSRAAATKRAQDLAIPQRERNGRLKRAPSVQRAKLEPTPEQKALKDVLRGKPGDPNDWIDVAAAHDLLAEKPAEALRRYRSLGQAYSAVCQTPREAPDILAGLMPRSTGTPSSEEAQERVKAMFESAQAYLRKSGRKTADSVDRHVSLSGMPLSGSMERVKTGGEWLVDWFGL